jgi:hypothetical protein
MYLSSVEKLVVLPVTSKHMKELTLDERPLHISNVEKLLPHRCTSKHMNEFTLE